MEDRQARADIDRLWGVDPSQRSHGAGPRTPRTIAAAAIGLADAEGLNAVSIRSVAKAVGLSAMGLYTYVPGKPELIALMVDEAYAALPSDIGADRPWRERLAKVAWDNWTIILRHPWLAEVEGHRPVLGPNVIAKYDRELGAFEGLGLEDVTMDHLLAGTLAFVSGAARQHLDGLAVARRTQESDSTWWQARAGLLADRMGTRFGRARRVGAAVGSAYDSAANPEATFRLGLEVWIEGVGRHLARSRLSDQ